MQSKTPHVMQLPGESEDPAIQTPPNLNIGSRQVSFPSNAFPMQKYLQ
jgi:hypothetical protein